MSIVNDDLTPEEIAASAREGRKLVHDMTGLDVPDTTPVNYEKKTLLCKLGGVWWVFIIGEEKGELSITFTPFSVYFAHTNDMLLAIESHDGPGALNKVLGVDIEIIGNDDTPGEPSPTLN